MATSFVSFLLLLFTICSSSLPNGSTLRVNDLFSNPLRSSGTWKSQHTSNMEGMDIVNTNKSISSLLQQNGLPIGLLPSSVESYDLSPDGSFTVSLAAACYVSFDYEVYYAPTVTGKLSYGTISDLSGIQAKQALLWLSVTAIRVDIPVSDYIYFTVGPISKKLSIAQFEDIPTCKSKASDTA